MSVILLGQHPRSEPLVRGTRDLDRGRMTSEDLSSLFTEDRKQLRNLQQGCPYLSTGMFQFDDLLRPFAELVENCSAGTLTRFFETNTFWRSLELDAAFQFREEHLSEWLEKYYFPDDVFSRDDPIIFTFPFLFLFKDFSRGFSIENICEILKKAAIEAGKQQQGMIVFVEPTFGWREISNEEKKATQLLLQSIKQEVQLPIALIQYFFPIENDQEFLLSLPVDMVGIDFYSNRLEPLLNIFPQDKTLLAGVISIESAAPEQEEPLRDFFQKAQRKISREKIFLTPSGPSELLPRSVFDAKLKHIMEITDRL